MFEVVHVYVNRSLSVGTVHDQIKRMPGGIIHLSIDARGDSQLQAS